MAKSLSFPQLSLLALCVWLCTIVSDSSAEHRFKRTYNVDPSFSIWPNKARILYYLDSYYTEGDKSLIRAGIAQIMSNMQGCITFVETDASDTNFKIKVTPFDTDGTLRTFCYSYQGQMNYLVNTGASEQPLVITGGPNGCLDGSLHNIMKYFAIVLGKRNEHQRGDRDRYITVYDQNIIVPNSYRLYNTSEAVWTLFPYDFCSITHNKMTDYAAPGTLAFSPVSGPQAVPFLDTISYYDCRIISMEYSCPAAACKPLDCNQARLAAAGNAGSSTTPSSGGLSEGSATGMTNGPAGPSTMAPGGAGASTMAPGSGASTAPGAPTPAPGLGTPATAGPGSGTTAPSASGSQPTMAPATPGPLPTTTTPGSSPSAANTAAPGATTAGNGPTTVGNRASTATNGSTAATSNGPTTASNGAATVTNSATTAGPAFTITFPSVVTSNSGTFIALFAFGVTAATPGAITSASVTASTVTITSTTTATPTTTPECATDWFCTSPPDESTYLYGPYMPNPTLLLTRGKCIMEFKQNYQTGKMDPLGTPLPIASYFPGPGGPTAPFPLSMNYMTPDPATNNATYLLNMIGPWSQKALTCSMDPARPPTTAATCPVVADALDINVQDITSRFSSASSQLSFSDGQIYQYVVNKPSRSEIGLMNTDFSESYQNTTGFLKGQTKIYQITAIQVMSDPDGIDAPMLAVFGIGSDGQTGYVGYVQMPLNADPDQPLSPVKWISPPVPMSVAFSSGC